MTGLRSHFFGRVVRGSLALSLLGVMLAPAAFAQITRDDTPEQNNVGDLIADQNGTFTILGEDGVRRNNGELVVHSFSDFNLNAGETALYTEDAQTINAVRNVLTRVTGSNASSLNGKIQSDYPNADLLFMNPNGVFFGPAFSLDVKQGFHVSTANSLDFQSLLQTTAVGIDVLTAIPDLTAATPEAWGFLGAGPKADITVEGFDVVDVEGASFDKVFSFMGGNVAIGTDGVPIDLNTNGRSLNIGAIGQQESAVHEFYERAGNGTGDIGPSLTTVGQGGVDLDPTGLVSYRGQNGISTVGLGDRNGDVLIAGGTIDLSSGLGGIDTGGGSGLVQQAGDVFLFGRDILLGMDINTGSTFADSGDVFVSAFDSFTFGSANKVDSISTGARQVGASSGFVQLFVSGPGGTLNADNVEITASSFTNGNAQFVSLFADNLNFVNSEIFGITSRSATPVAVQIFGSDVDLTNSQIFARTSESPDGFGGGNIDITGTSSLTLTNAFLSTLAIGNFGTSGDGGDITVTTPNLIGFDPISIDIASGTGEDGTFTCNAPQCPGGSSNIIRDDTLGQQNTGALTPIDDVYFILGEDGVSRDSGKLILHSFSDFNLDANETALYTTVNGNLNTPRSIITRVTGSTPSILDGQIVSDYAFADLYFVNNNGVFFGSDFTIDVTQSFHTSTADYLDMQDLFDTSRIAEVRLDMTTAQDVRDDLDDFSPFSWGFLSTGPDKLISVNGFNNLSTGGTLADRHFSFVGGDVQIGSDFSPVDISTGGRDLTVIAIGNSGEVEDFNTDTPDFPSVRDFQGNRFPGFGTGQGQIIFQGSVDTASTTGNNLVGDVDINGGDVDLGSGTISTNGTGQLGSAGNVTIRAQDVFLDSDIDTGSVTGRGGRLNILAIDAIEIAPNRTLSTVSETAGMSSGGVRITGSSIVADNIQITVGTEQSQSRTQGVSLEANTISFVNSIIDSVSSGFTGGLVEFSGPVAGGDLDLDLTGAQIDVHAINGGNAGDVVIHGNLQVAAINSRVDLTLADFDMSARGTTGNGGDIIVTTNTLIGDDPGSYDFRALGTGTDGEFIFDDLGPPPGASNIIRDNTLGQTAGNIDPIGNVYTIDGEEGVRRDGDRLVLHSFSDFNLEALETARYTDTGVGNPLTNTETVLTRVTGNNASQIDGTIISDYLNADLVFVNSNGVFFGEGFALDVAQGFHVSTADFFEVPLVANGDVTQVTTTSPDAVPDVTLESTFAWGFLSANPAAIVVAGLDDMGLSDAAPDPDFSFIGGDVSFGTDQVPIDLETNGRNLIAVAIGGRGRVEDARDTADEGESPVVITDLNGNAAIAQGDIRLRGDIDTSGTGAQTGAVVMQGRNIDLTGSDLDTGSSAALLQNAGDVLLFGTSILMADNIETDSFTGDGGDVIIRALDSIDFSPNAEIDSSSDDDSSQSGEINLQALNSINGDDLYLRTGSGSSSADAAGVSIVAVNQINILELEIDASTSGDAVAETVFIAASRVDILQADIDVSTTGPNVVPGAIELIGTQRLDVTDSDFDASAAGVGSDGGNIGLTTAEFINEGAVGFDVAQNGGGGAVDGTVTVTILDGAVPDPVPDIPTFPELPIPPGVINPPIAPIQPGPGDPAPSPGFNDPIGFGDLQPAEPTANVAAAPAEPTANVAAAPADSDGDGQGDDDQTSNAVTSATDGSSAGQGEQDLAVSISEDVEEQIAVATASVEAESQKKSSSVPGVSLFTNVSQRSPLVPRTCESIAGGDTKSRFLARTNKRLPTSPEDWLIAFDTSGERLIAAANNPDLPSVAAIDSSGSNLEDVKRSARTQRALASAAAAVRAGRYDEAASGFEQAVRDLEASGDPRGASEALLAYAQLQLTDGRYLAARQSLERALALAEPLGDEGHTAGVRTSLGNALIGTGELVRAEAELTRGLNIVLKSSNDQPAASVLNNLGNQRAASRDFGSAILAYEQSAKLARKLGNSADEARALSGAARAAAEGGHFAEAQRMLDRAMPLVGELADARERVPLFIHMGTTFAHFVASSPAARPKSLMNAFTAFDSALKAAEQFGDLRGIALANLNLGALYRDEQYRSEALYLTRLARRAAEGLNAPELLYRAHWQEGQILWAEHQVAAALAAHRRAIEILEETKPVASDGYGSSDANFQIAVGGVYQDTVDLLLQTASMMQNQTAADHLIAEARDTLEKFKGAELRDYFEDECIASVSGEGRRIDKLGAKAAVVYTVTLPDRIELLVGLPTGIERFTTKVAASRVIRTIDQFRAAVQSPLTNRHRALGKEIYEWTVAPYADRIAELGIETLVFIPDGRLRTLPFAALSDGEHYVSERYATATALSLRLLTSPDVASESGRPVLAGVSESVQGFSELAAVDSELMEIQAIEGGGELFLNQDFTLDEIRAAVDREVPGVVHLATHAVFTGDPDTSFLLTYAGRVGFDDLSDVVGMTRADGAPLDLLVLSACETAVGNDRAGLGFTGSAIRAGARSALGSLWPISDAAARELMIDFYRGLQSPDITKAEALRKAQATLRDNERFAHPFYWAPFTLVNDWM